MRKRSFISLGSIVIALTAFAFVSTSVDRPKPESATIIGEVIDIADYAMHGRHGEEHIASRKYRADHGFPIGILEEETGTVWVAVYRLPVPAAGLQTANATLGPLMGKKVVAQGLLYRAQGTNVIRLALAREY